MADAVIQVSDSTFDAEVLKSQVPVLVDFWAEWCGPCRQMGPTIDAVAAEFAGKAKIGKLNVDDNGQTAMRYNIRGIPTLLLFKDGKVVEQRVGAVGKSEVLKMLEPHVRELAVRILDQAIAKGRCDFVTDVAAELPLEVIAELLGVPGEDRQKLFDWTNQALGSADAGEVDPEYFVAEDAIDRSRIEMFTYVQNLCEQRRKEPGDDLMSQLLDVELEGDKLTDFELDAFFMFLSAASNETTRNAISHGMVALSRYPDERQKWWADFDGLAPTAVEEIVRWASPIIFMRRTLTEDTELSGTHMKAGDKVSMWYSSANRDERKFANPWMFDVARQPNPQIGFGAGGAHFCLGANLARREVRLAFEELHRQIPDIVAIAEPATLRSAFVHGIKRLQVGWTPPA